MYKVYTENPKNHENSEWQNCSLGYRYNSCFEIQYTGSGSEWLRSKQRYLYEYTMINDLSKET